MEAVGEFTKEMWTEVEDVYKQILECEFTQALAKGNLSEKAFKHYLAQDVLYMKEDAECLMRMSKRSNVPEEKDFFYKMSTDCVEIEEILHNDFMKYFDITPAKRLSPAFKEYCDFLDVNTKKEEYFLGVAALLPCFWLYGKVGIWVLSHHNENNKYKKFIDTYSGDDYINYTRTFIQIMENQAKNLDSISKKKIFSVFRKSCIHELKVFEESTNL